MESQKNQVTDSLKKATNVLVTVSSSPSVDQLAAAIGLTLLLNKLGKHATAVFSGQMPNTIEFLQPEKTFEKTTDSLRDFIIALDKSKADKLRYKVEDQMVKIFITPYRTSISDKDLEFSQGDFNVDVVMALGVTDPKDLDQAITSHGRILHDATVISANTTEGAKLGTINWTQKETSSLCEMLLDVGLALKADALDAQIATAFLTGIVSETDRFSNEKTSSATMQLSAKLIAAGANQQLVATQLEPPEPLPVEGSASVEKDVELPEVASAAPPTEVAEIKKDEEGALEVDHGEKKPVLDINNLPDQEPEENPIEQIDIDKEGMLLRPKDREVMKQKVVEPLDEDGKSKTPSRLITKPPTLGGTLTANSAPEHLDPSVDPIGAGAQQGPLLTHNTDASSQNSSPAANASAPNTLSDLEKVVDSPHLKQSAPGEPSPGHVDAARDAVQQAVSGTQPHILEPVQSLNAHPVDLNPPTLPTSPAGQVPNGSTMVNPATSSAQPVPAFPPLGANPTSPTGFIPPKPGLPTDNTAASVDDPTAPPPVPPPMMPPLPPTPPTPPTP